MRRRKLSDILTHCNIIVGKYGFIKSVACHGYNNDTISASMRFNTATFRFMACNSLVKLMG